MTVPYKLAMPGHQRSAEKVIESMRTGAAELSLAVSVSVPGKPANCQPSFARKLDDDARRVDRGIGLAERGDHSIAAAFGWAEIHKQHLVLFVVNDFRKLAAAPNKVHRCELTFENRILQVIAEAAHHFVHPAKPLVVANVVANQI